MWNLHDDGSITAEPTAGRVPDVGRTSGGREPSLAAARRRLELGPPAWHAWTVTELEHLVPAWLNLPEFALYHVGENDAGNLSMKSLGRTDTEIKEMFG